MKSIFSSLALLSLATSASAHYIFLKFASGGVKYNTYEHIRYNTNYNSPVTDLASKDLRCNVGGATGSNTTTVAVKAGDSFTFTSDVAVYHQGPISLYMSKAPGAVADYDGSGGWFKIYDWGPTFSGGQATWPLRSMFSLLSLSLSHPLFFPFSLYVLTVKNRRLHLQHPQVYSKWRVSSAHPESRHP